MQGLDLHAAMRLAPWFGLRKLSQRVDNQWVAKQWAEPVPLAVQVRARKFLYLYVDPWDCNCSSGCC